MEELPDSPKPHLKGWILIVLGSLLLGGFLTIEMFLSKAGVEIRPAWNGVAPIVLSVCVILGGIWLLRRSKR